MEQMDQIFGGSSAQENVQLMAEIRDELGLSGSGKVIGEEKVEELDTSHVEKV